MAVPFGDGTLSQAESRSRPDVSKSSRRNGVRVDRESRRAPGLREVDIEASPFSGHVQRKERQISRWAGGFSRELQTCKDGWGLVFPKLILPAE